MAKTSTLDDLIEQSITNRINDIKGLVKYGIPQAEAVETIRSSTILTGEAWARVEREVQCAFMVEAR